MILFSFDSWDLWPSYTRRYLWLSRADTFISKRRSSVHLLNKNVNLSNSASKDTNSEVFKRLTYLQIIDHLFQWNRAPWLSSLEKKVRIQCRWRGGELVPHRFMRRSPWNYDEKWPWSSSVTSPKNLFLRPIFSLSFFVSTSRMVTMRKTMTTSDWESEEVRPTLSVNTCRPRTERQSSKVDWFWPSRWGYNIM